MKLRLDLAAEVARRYRGVRDPLALCDDALGAALSPATREAVTRAESREQGLALALMSPDFQRR